MKPKKLLPTQVPTGKSSLSVADQTNHVDLADQANHVNHAEEMQIKWIMQANQTDQTVIIVLNDKNC